MRGGRGRIELRRARQTGRPSRGNGSASSRRCRPLSMADQTSARHECSSYDGGRAHCKFRSHIGQSWGSG